MGDFPANLHPDIAKALAEERQREMLEEVHADRLADDDPENDPKEPTYKPVTDSDNDLVKSPEKNTKIPKE